MRFRSKKREALYRERRPLVALLLEEHPICQRCGSQFQAEPVGQWT